MRGDLHGLPSAVLLVGTLDPLLSDSELFAAARGSRSSARLFQDDRGPLNFDNDVEGVNLAVECHRDRFAGISFYVV